MLTSTRIDSYNQCCMGLGLRSECKTESIFELMSLPSLLMMMLPLWDEVDELIFFLSPFFFLSYKMIKFFFLVTKLLLGLD